MAPKPWTGISTACTHWFSLLPQEKNRRQGRHGGQTLAPVAVCPLLPCPHKRARKRAPLCFPQGPAQDFGPGKGMRPCLALLLFRDMAQNLQCPRPGQGFVARFEDEALPILPGGRPMRVLEFGTFAGGSGRPGIRLLKGVLGKIYGCLHPLTRKKP